MKVGDRGYLAHLDAYVIYVEFVGFDVHEPDYPAERTRYYRALEPCNEMEYATISVGDIIDEYGPHDEQLFDDRAQAYAVVQANAEYWLKRKEQELDKLRKRAGK